MIFPLLFGILHRVQDLAILMNNRERGCLARIWTGIFEDHSKSCLPQQVTRISFFSAHR